MTSTLKPASGKTEVWLHQREFALGMHRGSRRVWLEGKRLVDAGFKAGLRYQLGVQGDALVLRLSPAGDHKVSGTPKRPVVGGWRTRLGQASPACSRARSTPASRASIPPWSRGFPKRSRTKYWGSRSWRPPSSPWAP